MSTKLVLTIPVTNFVMIAVPGGKGQKEGFGYVSLPDIPADIIKHGYVAVNPRIPTVNSDGFVTSGKGPDIIETILNSPEKMQNVSRGFRILVEKVVVGKNEGGQKHIVVTFTDLEAHGIVDGLHSFMATLYCIAMANGSVGALRKGKIPIYVRQGADVEDVPEIAEGLNSSLQVDKASIANLRKLLDPIKQSMQGHHGAGGIAYHQGDSGINITKIIGLLNLMDIESFKGIRKGNRSGHPVGVYRQAGKVINVFSDRCAESQAYVNMVAELPALCRLRDKIMHDAPVIYNRNGGRFGGLNEGVVRRTAITLPFSQQSTNYTLHQGWMIPIFAAFRANAQMKNGKFTWKKPLDKVYDAVIDQLVLNTIGIDSQPPAECGRNAGLFGQLFSNVEAKIPTI